MDKKVLLMILDGWGIGDHTKSDVIYTMHPKYITALTEKYPHAQLRTDGENVGLPNGQMGNSEVGHLNIGAGRVVYQDLVKINRACADNSILQNPEIVKAFEYAKKNGVNVHFMGLTSDGGVTEAYTRQSTISTSSARYQSITASRTPIFTASWTAVTPTPRAARDSLPTLRSTWPQRPARSLRS